jgi:hypothetical protein
MNDMGGHVIINGPLGTGGGVGIEGTAGGTPVPVSGTVTIANTVNLENSVQPNGTQADQRLTVDDTVGGVQLSAFHTDTVYVFWSCETAECRVTFDGSAPTTTNGHIVSPGDSGTWSKALATAAKWIKTGMTSAVIHASQLK